MTPAEFLKAVWPETGLYCIAIPGDKGYKHYVRDTLARALHIVDQHKNTDNVFFCVHALKEEKIWDADKRDPKTGELGAWRKRCQRNMRAARCFFFDLDVGDSTSTVPKYPTQLEAMQGLIAFCTKAKLPKPLVASSGGGLHVYWLLTDELPSDEWHTYAIKLRAVALHYGLRHDPMRTVDTASILRVAGTFNHKKEQKRPVEVLVPGQRTPTGEFLKLLDDAVIRTGITVRQSPRFPQMPIDSGPAALFEDNVSQNVSGLPPPDLMAVLKGCKMSQEIIAAKGDVPEPVWFHFLNLLRFVEDGRKFAHKWSSAASDKYSFEKTEEYLDKLEAKRFENGRKMGPTMCARLVEAMGTDSPCQGCQFASKNSTPIHAARCFDEAPAPVISVQGLEDVVIDIQLPPPPRPFARLKTGIAVTMQNGDNKEETTIIYENDLIPIQRLINRQHKTEQMVWQVTLPREGEHRFILDANALYDRQKFTNVLSNNGIYPKIANLTQVQEYMVSYIKELQRIADADHQVNHLGWASEDFDAFILPDRIITSDGKSKPVSLSKGVVRSSQDLFRKGSLRKQIELLKFYDHPQYIAHQYFIMNAFAAPMFHATGHNGCVVHAWGETGASKSTALYTAASVWGHPRNYPMNGTKHGATERARMERMNVLANLPIMIDEITHLESTEAHALAMGISQPGTRMRLEGDGTEQQKRESYKATIMLSTANSSLHSLLAMQNTAGTASSMRVIEMVMPKTYVHKKWDADDFLLELSENFGHLGEIFVADMMRDRSYVERVRALDREISMAAKLSGGERFHGANIATVVAAAERSRRMGLTYFDPDLLKKWALTVQLPAMRGVVTQEYAGSGDLLAAFLDHIDGNILVTSPGGSAIDTFIHVEREPRGQLLAHYDMGEKVMYVTKQPWKHYCARIGANATQALRELALERDSANRLLIKNTSYRRVLGAGTKWGKLPSACFIIDMRHDSVVTRAEGIRHELRKDNPDLPTVH